MSEKTLADELRSVLLARSLDAPEPTETMRGILADTVGTGASPHPELADRPGAADQPGGRVRATRPGWLSWPPSGFLIAAVTVALLVIGVGALARLGQSGQSGSATGSSAGGSVAQNSAEKNSAGKNAPGSDSARSNSAGGGAGTGSAMGPRVQANGTESPGGSANQGSPAPLVGPTPPFPKDLNCSSIGGGRRGIGAWAADPATPGSNGLRFYEFRCSGPSGQRLASEVQEFRRTGSALAYVQTLLPLALNQQVDFLTVEGGAVLIQSANASGADRGDVVQRTYTLDSRPGYRVTAKLVARACSGKDLSTTGSTSAEIRTTSGTVVSAHALLQFTNRSYLPCAIEGYPAVRSLVGSRAVGPPTDTMLSGVGGGIRNGVVPPIVVLAPGSTAAAIVELGEWTGSSQCASTDHLAVSLPNGTVLPAVPVSLGACAVTVHPVVDSPLGSD